MLSRIVPLGKVVDCRISSFLRQDLERFDRIFSLRKDDLLICRSVGSYDMVAKCGVVEADAPDILFPDTIIRARLKPGLLPAYVREVMQTPLGRSHFQSNARTAVGMWKIGADDIASFPIPLPPLAVQRKLVEAVTGGRYVPGIVVAAL